MVRNEKGQFLKGHPALNVGVGVNHGGIQKSLKGEVRDALKLAEDAMPAIIADMISRATDLEVNANVRQQAAEYLIDRIYGKANQPLSSNAPWEIIVTYSKKTGGD